MQREDAGWQRFPKQDTPTKINKRRKIRPDHEKSGTGRIQCHASSGAGVRGGCVAALMARNEFSGEGAEGVKKPIMREWVAATLVVRGKFGGESGVRDASAWGLAMGSKHGIGELGVGITITSCTISKCIVPVAKSHDGGAGELVAILGLFDNDVAFGEELSEMNFSDFTL